MCKSSLFYYSLNINQYGLPTETCTHKIINYMYEESLPYIEACVGACVMNFIMFFCHFCIYTGGKKK